LKRIGEMMWALDKASKPDGNEKAASDAATKSALKQALKDANELEQTAKAMESAADSQHASSSARENTAPAQKQAGATRDPAPAEAALKEIQKKLEEASRAAADAKK